MHTQQDPSNTGRAMERPSYLDSGSSEALHPAARAALVAALEQGYADPRRLHSAARQARILLDNARAVTADCLGVRADEVSFTPSGTQAVHIGLLGLAHGARRVSPRLAISAVEHSAVFAAAQWWDTLTGAEHGVIPVDSHGHVRATDVAEALLVPTGVIAVQQANPEVGTIQRIDEVAANAGKTPLFLDACATGGLIALPDGWAAAALSAHKWGGPAGVGVLLVRKGARWRAPFPTDDRVDSRVSGFENVPAALASAAALQARVDERDQINLRYTEFAARLRGVLAGIPEVDLHGHADQRLAGLVSFSCLYLDGETLVTELDRLGFAVASGSACTASTLEPSHVLVAMGALTHGNVRVTFAPDTTSAEVDRLCAVLPGVVEQLRARTSR